MKKLINIRIESASVRSDYDHGSVEQTVCEVPIRLYGDIRNCNGKKINCMRLQKWGYRPVMERTTDGITSRYDWFYVVGLQDKHGHTIKLQNSYRLYAPMARELWKLYA